MTFQNIPYIWENTSDVPVTINQTAFLDGKCTKLGPFFGLVATIEGTGEVAARVLPAKTSKNPMKFLMGQKDASVYEMSPHSCFDTCRHSHFRHRTNIVNFVISLVTHP